MDATSYYGVYPYYGFYRQQVVASSAYGDVNGDGVPDYVYLTADASAEQGSPYLQNVTVNIQDGATKRVYTIKLVPNANSGYNPTVFLGDFTKDGVKDILVAIDSGGSGAFTFDYVFSFVHNQARKLFDFNTYNEQNRYTVQYMDGYKLKVSSLATKTDYLIDISGRGADYLSQLYDANGKLIKPVQGNANGVSGFYPVDMDRDGRYEIQAYQRITGLYNADSFGYVINTLQWDGSRFAIWQQWMAIFGSSGG
ncbi:FG-GAP-like repeat-containing protein [Paenibacillus sp.]|uniref:FG-GAP-like repeat-containing protein n=1 Tax=Paenibacillus sp. TaxID=58172 RepID=UPI002811AAD0|nr:FG-GAP-like repeat-containing protein [Paenibacillus sp.]